jgi:hypothetical protein
MKKILLLSIFSLGVLGCGIELDEDVAPKPSGTKYTDNDYSLPSSQTKKPTAPTIPSTTYTQPVQPPALPEAEASIEQQIKTLMTEALEADLISPIHYKNFETLVNNLSDVEETQEIKDLKGLFKAIPTRLGKIIFLKSLSSGNTLADVKTFGTLLVTMTDETQIETFCLMRDPTDLIQQWQDSCGPTIVQYIKGEYNPLFACALNFSDAVGIVNTGAGPAQQQKEYLEAEGGIAVPRQTEGGRGMPLENTLNRMLSDITTYQTHEYTATSLTEKIIPALQSGVDIPFRTAKPNDPESGHFLLVSAYRVNNGVEELFLYDPYYGKTGWIKSSQFTQNNFSPVFSVSNNPITHYYGP